MFKNILKNTDYVILLIILILFGIGVIGIFSAGYNSDVNQNEYIKQMIWFGVMFVALICIWFTNHSVYEYFGYVIFFVSTILLILVLNTNSLMGAKSWFNFGGFLYQPSELMKIGYILVAAKLFSTNFKSNLLKYSLIGVTFLIPFILILLLVKLFNTFASSSEISV
ncbi:MAG: FtsW/RodA/SpoVE family cell cycle protein [Clostridia bacterium]